MSKAWLSLGSIAVLILLGAVWWDSGYRPSWLSVDWAETTAAPFHVRDKLEIAARSYPFKRGSVSLLCGPDGPHLMLRTRLPLSSEERDGFRASKGYTLHTEVIFDWRPVPGGVTVSKFLTRSAIVALGSVDTAVTDALTDNDQAVLMDWFRRGAPQHLYLGVGEEGSGRLSSVSSANAVSHFLTQCRVKV